MAVPKRIIVEPQRMAVSKSPDIPMDSISTDTLSYFFRRMSTERAEISEKNS